MSQIETITLGGGCFWCVEAVFREAAGITSVVSGYMGGASANPSYKDVCSGTTGHVEVVQIGFDPGEITLRDILEIFFATHDPTTLNRQGNDAGTQYRSVIFYNSPEQKAVAEQVIKELTEEKALPDPIVTAVEPASMFYAAEDYHQQYFEKHPFQPYCAFVVAPKVQKFRKKFANKMKAAG